MAAAAQPGDAVELVGTRTAAALVQGGFNVHGWQRMSVIRESPERTHPKIVVETTT
jgi:hypothetical protein